MSAEQLSLFEAEAQNVGSHDAEIMKAIYRRVPVLVDTAKGVEGNLWGVSLLQMFDSSGDSHLFRTEKEMDELEGMEKTGSCYEPTAKESKYREDQPSACDWNLRRDLASYFNLYEAEMFHHFDHRLVTYENGNARTFTEDEKAERYLTTDSCYWVSGHEVVSRLTHRVPQELFQAWLQRDTAALQVLLHDWFVGWLFNRGKETKADTFLANSVSSDSSGGLPDLLKDYFVRRGAMEAYEQQHPLHGFEPNAIEYHIKCHKNPTESAASLISGRIPQCLLIFRDSCRCDDERTVIASMVPRVGVSDATIIFLQQEPKNIACFQANLTAFVFDFVARQKINSTNHLSDVLHELPVLPPATYDQTPSWTRGEVLCDWIAQRVLELNYTAFDLMSWAHEMRHDDGLFGWDVARLHCVIIDNEHHHYFRGEIPMSNRINHPPKVAHSGSADSGNTGRNGNAGGKTPRNGFRFKVLAYQRVSVHEDQTGSHTFETQSQRIREKLDVLYGVGGYDLETLTDNGISGAFGVVPTGVQRKTRPSLRTITDKLGTSSYDCLIVYNLSRFVRSPRWFHQLLEDVIVPSGVDFISATQDLNLGNADGRAMAGILSIMDGLFRDTVVQRNKDAARTRAEKGFYVGQIGYGWKWEPMNQVPENGRRRIIRNEEQSPWVLQMKDWYLAGWNLTRIAGELNNRGVTSASGQSRWTTSVVHSVLTNPVHVGLVPLGRHGQEWLPGEHADSRYYEADVLEQIKTTGLQRKSWKTNTLKPTVHLLNAIVHCERCGERLYVSSQNTPYRSYRCEKGASQGQRTCPNVTVRAEGLEQAVVRCLNQLLLEPARREVLDEEATRASQVEESRLQIEVNRLQTQLASIRLRFDKWADAFSRGVMDEAEFIRQRSSLQAEQLEAEGRLQESEALLQNRDRHQAWVAQVRANLLDFPLMWEHQDMDERRQLLMILLEKLTVDRRGRDAIVKIKIHMLPEQELPLMFRSMRHKNEKPSGLQSLTPRHLAFLYHVGQGKKRREIAELMNVSYATVSTYWTQVRDRLEVSSEEDAAKMAAERIEALLPTLPLGAMDHPHQKRENPVLTPALMEILPYIVKGATNNQIAQRTNLPVTTVGGRRARIMDILGVHSPFELAEKVQTLGLLQKK